MSTGGNQKPSTRRISARAWWIIGIGLLVIALAVFIFLGYYFRWRWTGFPPKRLFDWIQILVIPVAVAIGTFVLNRAAKRRDDVAQIEQREREQAIETERAEEASLQAYLDYISGLLTDPDRPLHRSRMGDNLSLVARAQTLTVLGRLEDGERKGSVLQFLHEAGLIDRIYPVVNLRGADLRGVNLLGADREADIQAVNLPEAFVSGAELRAPYLRGADLQRAYLYRASFIDADLRQAELQEANLQRAYLYRANLREANLLNANLQRAYLREADLREAYLYSAQLHEADLRGADLRGADLDGAMHLEQRQIKQAIGDDYTTLPEGIDRPKSWSARTDE